MKLKSLLIFGLLGLSACGVQNSLSGSGGSLNSANSSASAGSSGNSSGGSFGSVGSAGGNDDTVVAVTRTEYIDPRAFVNVIKSITSERTRGGTILRVVGEVPGQGYYNVDLVPVVSENSREMLFEFRAAAPRFPQPGPTTRSREIYAAIFVSELEQPGARTLRVGKITALQRLEHRG